jgi:hypothetical protein
MTEQHCTGTGVLLSAMVILCLASISNFPSPEHIVLVQVFHTVPQHISFIINHSIA